MTITYSKLEDWYYSAVDEGCFPYTALKKWLEANPDEEIWWKNYLRDCEIMEQELNEPLTHMPYFFWTDENVLVEPEVYEVCVEWDEDENNENGDEAK